SVRIEETNKKSAEYSTILLSPGEQDLMSTPLASNEDGILTWWYRYSLKPEKVYRVTGSYFEPGIIESRLRSWTWRVPVVARFLPQPKATFATSEWFEVSTVMRPKAN